MSSADTAGYSFHRLMRRATRSQPRSKGEANSKERREQNGLQAGPRFKRFKGRARRESKTRAVSSQGEPITRGNGTSCNLPLGKASGEKRVFKGFPGSLRSEAKEQSLVVFQEVC